MLALLLLLVGPSAARVFQPCELATELLHQHELPTTQIATWVCIAQHESQYNTSALNPSSGDHGLFQISELWWCTSDGSQGGACAKPCSAFRDDDIADDVTCAKRIYREHSRLSGDGFNAWVVYPTFCKTNPDKYIQECNLRQNHFINATTIQTTTPSVGTKSLYNARLQWNPNKITTQKSTTKDIDTKYRQIHKIIQHPTGSKYKYHMHGFGFALFKDN